MSVRRGGGVGRRKLFNLFLRLATQFCVARQVAKRYYTRNYINLSRNGSRQCRVQFGELMEERED